MKIDSFRLNFFAMLLVPLLFSHEVQSFLIMPSQTLRGNAKTGLQFHQQRAPSPTSHNPDWRSRHELTTSRVGLLQRDTTKLHMYNLPPGGGRGGGGLGEILKGAAGLILTVAFFASPVGGFVLGLFNSFLLLVFLVPTVATIGFQAWQYFNTISAPCPNCGAPARVVKSKDGESTPSLCFNCGAVLQASYDNSRIDNVTGRNSMNQEGVAGSANPNSIFDIFGGPGASSGSPFGTTSTTTEIYEVEEYDIPSGRSSNSGSKKKPPSKKDMGDIIDAEIEDDLPFQ